MKKKWAAVIRKSQQYCKNSWSSGGIKPYLCLELVKQVALFQAFPIKPGDFSAKRMACDPMIQLFFNLFIFCENHDTVIRYI